MDVRDQITGMCRCFGHHTKGRGPWAVWMFNYSSALHSGKPFSCCNQLNYIEALCTRENTRDSTSEFSSSPQNILTLRQHVTGRNRTLMQFTNSGALGRKLILLKRGFSLKREPTSKYSWKKFYGLITHRGEYIQECAKLGQIIGQTEEKTL